MKIGDKAVELIYEIIYGSVSKKRLTEAFYEYSDKVVNEHAEAIENYSCCDSDKNRERIIYMNGKIEAWMEFEAIIYKLLYLKEK